VRVFLTLVVGSILLGGCAASEKAVPAQGMSAQEERDRAACLEGAHGETSYDEKTFSSCMTARGYGEDKLYPGGTTANVGRPSGSDTMNTAAQQVRDPAGAVRENYDRAVADYQSCLLDHTSNLSECEKQRALMDADAKVLFGSSGRRNSIADVER
jgi:hypothetical protein